MNGVINVLKPPGMSSSGAVVFLKRLLGERHVGHAGTLDTGAAGVIVVLVGRASRLSDYIMGHAKTYIAEMRLGAATDTLDSYGSVTEQRPASQVDRQRLADACAGFLGRSLQTPPDYSAVKIGGRKSYEMARRGIHVDKPPREIMVDAIDILECREGRFLLKIHCSKGTYIRTLLFDIAHAMGEVAYTSFLLRVESGSYHVRDAYTIDEIIRMTSAADFSFLLSAESAVADLPALELESAFAFALQNGQAIQQTAPWETFRLYCGGMFYGVGRCQEGTLRLKIPLY